MIRFPTVQYPERPRASKKSIERPATRHPNPKTEGNNIT
jgi:hypothetical protein